MLDPIRARFASSCSRKGIKDAEIEAIWFGATSVKLILSGVTTGKSAWSLAITLSLFILPDLS